MLIIIHDTQSEYKRFLLILFSINPIRSNIYIIANLHSESAYLQKVKSHIILRLCVPHFSILTAQSGEFIVTAILGDSALMEYCYYIAKTAGR